MISLQTVTQVELGDTVLDITVLPLKKILDYQTTITELDKIAEEDVEKQLEVMINIAMDIITRNNKDIKREFVEDNLTMPGFQVLTQIAFGALKE